MADKTGFEAVREAHKARFAARSFPGRRPAGSLFPRSALAAVWQRFQQKIGHILLLNRG
jgi:hypothetical protein